MFYFLLERLGNIKEGMDKESMLDTFDGIYNEDNFIEQAMGDEDGEEDWRDIYQSLEHHIQRARQALVKLVNSDVSDEDIPTCWWEGIDAWDAMDEKGIDDYLGGLVKAEKELLPSAPGAGEAPEEIELPSKEKMISIITTAVNQVYRKEGLKPKAEDLELCLDTLSNSHLKQMYLAAKEGDTKKTRSFVDDVGLQSI